MRRWSHDLRGVTLFYLWSLVTTCAIVAFCILDGGATSPLTWLFVLTLTYAGLAYPPAGVLLTGAFTIGAFAVVAASGPVRIEVALMQAATLGLLSVMISWASRNEWELIQGSEELAERLALLAETDVLTGALNRRAFDDRLTAAAATTCAESPLSLCMVDLDGFKRVNDDLGHPVGDALLGRIADAVLSACRDHDTVARLGGDEFAVLLPGTPAVAARAIGERVRRAVADCGAAYHVTASVGVVTTIRPADGTRLLTGADRLMYDAKRAGGNATRSVAPPVAG
jgi:diguanylate cyclase (GGDEF)-like protein